MIRQILLVPAVLALILAFATASSHPVLADPTIRTVDHPLADPALEARARALMRDIRCVVCQSQSIDESDADIATNLRNIVREQLATMGLDWDAPAYPQLTGTESRQPLQVEIIGEVPKPPDADR